MTTSNQDPLKLEDLFQHTYGGGIGFMRVQILHKHETMCGVVLDGFRGTVDMFRVRTDIGEGWVQAHKVRQCSGLDGRCMCAGESSAASGATCSGRGTSTGRGDALGAVPLGNTGTTVGHGVAA